MSNFQIGDLISLKNHPYSLNQKTKIGANALMTPPIMVVTEILKQNKFNPDSEDEEKLLGQVLGTFYSSKNCNYEKFWFNVDEIILIDNAEKENIDKDIAEKKTVPTELTTVKKAYKGKQVILNSADAELGKKKISWSIESDKEKFRTESYMDFLPPVMTVIDVVENSKFLKDRRDPKDGTLKKDSCKFLLKCKWYNPSKQSFSEEFIPFNIVEEVIFDQEKIDIIQLGMSGSKLFKIPKITPFEGHNKRQINNTLVEIINIILLNHKIRIVYSDYFSKKVKSSYIQEFNFEATTFKITDLTKDKFPDYSSQVFNDVKKLSWEKDKFYEINYTDRKGRFTQRIITNCSTSTFENEDEIEETFIIANCLLRKGDIRHFRLKNIIERSTLTKDFENLLM